MKRPTRLEHAELIDLVQTLQDSFYLRQDEQGRAIWDPDADVNGGDLVEILGTQLRLHGLCPQEVLLAKVDVSIENLLAAWGHGNRRAVARVMSERTRTEIAEFTTRLARGPGVEESSMFATLLDGMEIHSRRHDNRAEIDKSRRELGMTNVGPNGPRAAGHDIEDDDEDETDDD